MEKKREAVDVFLGMKYALEKAPIWMHVDYTCGCGLYIHPDSPHRNKEAIHIPDCDGRRYARANQAALSWFLP